MYNEAGWLSQDAHALQLELAQAWRAGPRPLPATDFDVLIIGSGYGGAVAALRLSQAWRTEQGQTPRIALLERGREYLPGMFPKGLSDLAGARTLQPAGRRSSLKRPAHRFVGHTPRATM